MSERGHTAYEYAHDSWAVDHKTTADEIAAYVAANRPDCGICPGVECRCQPLKPPEGITRRRTAGAAVRGHTEALPPIVGD